MKAIVSEVVDEAKDIKSFRLIPEGEIKQTPGQWMYVRLAPELKHHFTISSSPTENRLQFTTKFRQESDYKQKLWSLKPGAEIEVNGPFGSFVIDNKNANPKIFLAGGIGITPFRSQLKYICDKGLNVEITLLYSGKRREEMAFCDELESMNQRPSIKVAVIETEAAGRVNAETVKRYCQNWKERDLWVCGPTTMVEAMVEMAQKMGFEPDAIRSEEFTGY